MKDAKHHLKHIQKKVMQSARKEPKTTSESYLSEFNFKNESNENIKKKMARHRQIKSSTQI